MKTTTVVLLLMLIISWGTLSQTILKQDGTQPGHSAIFNAKAINNGIYSIPAMTKSQRDAIDKPSQGMQVLCSDCNSDGSSGISVFNNGIWTDLLTICCYSPTAGIHIPSATQIIWKWNYVFGADGYLWNTVNDVTTAVDVGLVYSKNETGLACSTSFTRYLWAYINCCGESSSISMTQSTLWCCGNPITDSRDAKIYNTVLIGTQCWMKENLNIGTRINSGDQQTNNSVFEKYCYNESESNCDVYGGLYQWNELMNYTTSSNSNPSGRQGICPSGWHIPSDAEWDQLMTFLGGESIAGGPMKETGTIHWNSPNTGATNSSGFTALPGGFRDDLLWPFYNFGTGAYFWSSTERPGFDNGYLRYLFFNTVELVPYDMAKVNGESARCVMD